MEIFGIKEEVMDGMISDLSAGEGYHYWPMLKKSGGYRLISSPSKFLKEAQKRILIKISAIPIHRAAHGFRKRYSIITSIQEHLKLPPRSMLNIDLEDAFPSTDRERIRVLLTDFMQKKAIEVLKLDKKDLSSEDLNDLINDTTDSLTSFLLALVTDCGRLPQGSPASPAILNLACFKLDQAISNLLPKSKYVYTRYADDLTISCRLKNIPTEIIKGIEDAVKESGYTINRHKQKYTSLRGGNNTFEVTGLLISNGKIILKKDKRIAFENILYALSKKEELSEREWNRAWGIIDFIASVYGSRAEIPRWALKHSEVIQKIPVIPDLKN